MNPIAMTIVFLVGWGAFAYSSVRRWRLMMIGAPDNRADNIGQRIALTFRYAIAQMRMRRYPLAGMAHMLIFSGFMVLLFRTLVLWGRGFDELFNLWILGPDQTLGQIYAFLKDIFAVLVILGTLAFIYFRVIKKLGRMTLSTEGLVILLIILTMMLADIFYDGATIVQHADDRSAVAFHLAEPAGSLAATMISSASDATITIIKHVGFWTHACLVLIFLNLLPYSKHFHVITGIPNVFAQRLHPPGRLPPIEDIDGKLEREETLGIRRLNQFSWKAIMDWYTCTECGRCTDHCPAAKTGKKLSPKHFTLDLRDFLYKHEDALVADSVSGKTKPDDESDPKEHQKDLIDGVIDPEVLWACTTCGACEQECPVFITYVDKIVDMRRYLVQERGEFPNELQTAFRSIESSSNPWGFPADERAKWSEGLDVKTIAENPDAPVLFWIGCAPAFDERAKKVTRATAKLMQKAGIDFAILGNDEQCTGDPARRAGNEYLFQMLANANVEILNGVGADKKKIITTCPHCFNTLANEYADFGGTYDVIHHTTFLAQLVKEGKLKPVNRVDKRVAYHDSCYLGRYNDIYDDPREALKAIPGVTLVEPAETRDRGMCCGAGGAQMFKEEEKGDERVNVVRTLQLLDTKPDTIATGCPFCMRMITDGLADHDKETLPQLDVAEMLLEAIEDRPASTG
jgi:Fe-S oxidoreductase